MYACTYVVGWWHGEAARGQGTELGGRHLCPQASCTGERIIYMTVLLTPSYLVF